MQNVPKSWLQEEIDDIQDESEQNSTYIKPNENIQVENIVDIQEPQIEPPKPKEIFIGSNRKKTRIVRIADSFLGNLLIPLPDNPKLLLHVLKLRLQISRFCFEKHSTF